MNLSIPGSWVALRSRVRRMLPVVVGLVGAAIAQPVAAESLPLFPPVTVADATPSRGQIIVGVRRDARPFSYRTAARHNEEVFPDFGGYMIEICRRVLSDMTRGVGPFRDFTVVTREVGVAGRFDALENENVDMLCGPDSITPNRLEKYNVSHPMFLSGLTWVTVENDEFPQGAYCKAVLGLLARTTAETVGLQVLADRNELFRFDQALEQYLALARGGGNTRTDTSLLSEVAGLISGYPRGQSPADQPHRTWVEPIDSSTIVTKECPGGFKSGPVVQFSSHDDGLEALCNGEIFYYLGDRDILRSKEVGFASCGLDVKTKTMTKEAYGAYFRKTRWDQGGGASRHGRFPDSALQAQFNNVLLRLMQESSNILDYQFRREFSPELPTEELQNFFDSFKFASHHIREN